MCVCVCVYDYVTIQLCNCITIQLYNYIQAREELENLYEQHAAEHAWYLEQVRRDPQVLVPFTAISAQVYYYAPAGNGAAGRPDPRPR